MCVCSFYAQTVVSTEKRIRRFKSIEYIKVTHLLSQSRVQATNLFPIQPFLFSDFIGFHFFCTLNRLNVLIIIIIIHDNVQCRLFILVS